MMMTTQGGIRLDYAIEMTDKERMRWLQRCIDYNEAMEEKRPGGPDRPQDRF